MKEIGAVYEAIESEHEGWSFYSTEVMNAEEGHRLINRLWVSGGEGEEKLSKLESHHLEDHGETKVQFYFKGDQLLFTLDRTENVLIEPNVTDVTEKRYYFADGQLIRLRSKEGRFAAGKSTDTSGLKNREVPLSEIENVEETYVMQHEMAAPLLEQLLHLNEEGAGSESGPGIGGQGGHLAGDGWRAILGSGSRNGQFVLAWGQQGESAPKGDLDEEGFVMGEQEAENLVNYVVNARTGQVIGVLAGKHFGDRSSYNHDRTETAWSAGELFFAQVNSGKWATYDATVYALSYDANGNSVSKGADLLESAKGAVFEQLKGGAEVKKFAPEDFSISLQDPRIVYQGGDCVIQAGVIGQIPKSEEEGSSFEATVTFRLTMDENGGAPVLAWSGTEMHQ